jgi:hypothetical protein
VKKIYAFFSSSEWQIGEILEKIRVQTEIKKVAITLYLDETNLVCFSSDFSH